MSVRWGMTTLLLSAASLAIMPGQALAQKRQRDRITREEILSSAHRELDVYQVIRSLRPQFLEPPRGVRTLGGSSGPAPVAVYIDRKRDIGLEALRTLMARDVEEVRYLDPSRSESEFGPTASGGAVLVRLYRARRDVPPVRDSTKPPPD